MFTDAIRASDKSPAPDISSPIFYVAELDDNCNAVPLNLHWIILEWQKSSRESYPMESVFNERTVQQLKIGNNICSFIDTPST